MTPLLPDQVNDYLDTLVPARDAEMAKMETYARRHNFPIIGPVAGHLCYQITRMTGARRVFEMGSGYGYSTAWFAKGVQENGGGAVHHVVWDEKLSQQAREHMAAMGFQDIVRYTVGEAVASLRESQEGPFDIIFNDINKEAYPESLAVIEEKLRPGGVLIIDNMLWSGRIFDDNDQSAATKGVRDFTRLITASPRWIPSLIPIRDGLIVAYYKR